MRLITKNFRLQFNNDNSKLIDTKSTNGEKWFDIESNKLYIDTKRIGVVPEEITSKKIIDNFAKLIKECIDSIDYVIDINKQWLTIKDSWKIPIDNGYIIKNKIPESEIPIVEKLIDEQLNIRKKYQDVLQLMGTV